MRRRFTGRALIAAAVMTVAGLAGSVTPAGAATRASADSSILNAAAGDQVHHCDNLGTSLFGYEAIVCVDIVTGSYAGGYGAAGVVNAYCQVGDTTQRVPCQFVAVDGIFANASGIPSNANSSCYTCGPEGLSLYLGTFNYTGGHDCASSLGHNVWTVAVGDTQIVTPDGRSFFVSGRPNDAYNYSSGHYWVCP